LPIGMTMSASVPGSNDAKTKRNFVRHCRE
jgi:hypothetical protein